MGKRITAIEAAEIIDVTPGRVRQLIASGALPVAETVYAGRVRCHMLDEAAVRRFARIPRPRTGRPKKPA